MKKLLALSAFALAGAAPALACGPSVNPAQLTILTLAMVTAPLLAALLVDRGAFALAAHTFQLPRRHTPHVAGPLLAFISIVVAIGSVGIHDLNLAVAGFALVPLAAGVCFVSFCRSVVLDMPGQLKPRLIRVFAVGAFFTIALLRILM